jgi:hypothetical protein
MQPPPTVGMKIACRPEFRTYIGSNVPSVRLVHDAEIDLWSPTKEQKGLIVFLIPPSYPDMRGLEITRVKDNVAFAREY